MARIKNWKYEGFGGDLGHFMNEEWYNSKKDIRILIGKASDYNQGNGYVLEISDSKGNIINKTFTTQEKARKFVRVYMRKH